MLTIHTNIEPNDLCAVMALLVRRSGNNVTLPDEEIDALLGEFKLVAEYVDGAGLVVTLAQEVRDE